MTAHAPLWARLELALVGDGEIAPLRVGDTFVAGLSIVADQRAEAEDIDGLRLTDAGRRLYTVTGIARSSGNTWVLDSGNLLLTTYQDPPGPTIGYRYTLHGTLAVAWTYEWDLATEPEAGGTGYDGRRPWSVQEIQADIALQTTAKEPLSSHGGSESVNQVPRWSDVDHWLRIVPIAGHPHRT